MAKRVLVFVLLVAFPTVPMAQTKEEKSVQEGLFRYQPNTRDPFIPLIKDGKIVVGYLSNQGKATPVLNGILWDAGGQSIALINEDEVRVGDTVGEYQVEAIQQDAVILRYGEETVTLQLPFDSQDSP